VTVSEQSYTRYTFRPQSAAGTDDLGVRDLLGELQPAGWEEDDGGRTVRFWLPRTASEDDFRRESLDRLAALGTLTSASQEAGWQDGWRRFHRPVVEGRVRVRPPWYPPEPGLLDVVVDTGMAFGTGAHFTTRLCLRALQQVTPGSLVDVGTGSGVLALAALRLGFAPVWAFDNDPVAVDSCARNAAANGLEPRLFLGDVTDPGLVLPAADVVVANLLEGPVMELARRLEAGDAAWAPPRLLLSGLLVDQGDGVLAAFSGYRLVRRDSSSGWLFLDLARKA
jgi:ribosomal protein L11 methyltransferase